MTATPNYRRRADMSLGQFSVAVGAPRRWVQNAIAVLGLKREYTAEGAKRLALARLLNRALRIPLVHAHRLAADALAAWPGGKTWEHRSEDGIVTLVVDLERFLSGFAVRLSLARSWYSERRRGRPRKRRRRGIAGAREYGVDITLLEQSLRRTPEERLRRLEEAARFFRSARAERGAVFAALLEGLLSASVRFVVIGGVAAGLHGSARATLDLDICYDPSPENRRRLARLLASWKAYPRGVEPGLPFALDERLLAPVLTLTTALGDLDVMDRVTGVGEFEEVLRRSVEIEAGGVRFRILDLPALLANKGATRRPKDLDQIPELEALLELRRRSAE